MATTDADLQRLRTDWREASGTARAAFGREVLTEMLGPRTEGSGEIVVQSLVSASSGEPVVTITWGRESGQLSPEEARAHALNVLEAASAAEADAFLMSFVQRRVGAIAAQAAQILVEFRAWRQRRAEMPEDPDGRTG